MIFDTLDNLGNYVAIHPLFSQVIAYLQQADLNALEPGKVELQGKDLFVNCQQTKPKAPEEARYETHDQYIDIQIPISDTEVMGYLPRKEMPEDASYNEEKDITYYQYALQNSFAVKPGMFVVFFPQDAHAPGITPTGVKKIIFKVKC